MGLIFKDIQDDQQEAMMDTMYIGQTWQMRYLKAKYFFWGTLASLASATVTAVIDYTIIKSTEHSGIIGWLFG